MSFLRHFNETRNSDANPEAKQKAQDFIISFFKESWLEHVDGGISFKQREGKSYFW